MTKLLTTHILLTVTHDKPIDHLTDVAAGRIFMYDHVVDTTAKLCHIDAIEPSIPDITPIDMVLYCPACGTQHIDEPDLPAWNNPEHRSHLCASCGNIWRPADVATNGVIGTKTHGVSDNPTTGYAHVAKTNDPIPAWNTSPEMLMAAARGTVFDEPLPLVVASDGMVPLETGVSDAIEFQQGGIVTTAQLRNDEVAVVLGQPVEIPFENATQLQRFIAHVKGERAVMITLL